MITLTGFIQWKMPSRNVVFKLESDLDILGNTGKIGHARSVFEKIYPNLIILALITTFS